MIQIESDGGTPEVARGKIVKFTTSLCPTCLTKIPAEVREREGQVWMDKRCEEHGPFSALLASDVRHYYVADHGVSALGLCCGPGQGCGDQLANHSCNVLIEITQRCNLTCPACYADSSPTKEQGFLPRAEVRRRLENLLSAGKSDLDLLQLSGGEPTIHPEFFEILDDALALGIRQVYVNTNGVRLARSEFAAELASRGERASVYLQFDGFREETYASLRGRGDLSEVKQSALANCEKYGINTVPVVTLVRGVNDDELGEVIRRSALLRRSVAKVMIQPAMYSGRFEASREAGRITVADVARMVATQTDGLFVEEDFTPIPCADPNCFSMAVALRHGDRLLPVSRYLPRYQDWASSAIADSIGDVADSFDRGTDLDRLLSAAVSSGALEAVDEETLDELLDCVAEAQREERRGWSNLFAIGVKPFMDAYTYDQDRVDKCCVHILSHDGTPVSFCEYNAVNRPLGRL